MVYIWGCTDCLNQVGYNELVNGECPICKGRNIKVNFSIKLPDIKGSKSKKMKC